MIIDYVGVKEINGSLIVIDGVKGVSNEEIVDIKLENGSTRQGRVVQIEGDRIVVQVFEGTRRISLKNTRTRLTGHPMEMPLSPEIIGRVLDGAGRPIDGLGDIFPVKKANINGTPINPVSRVYPKNYINTGISTIDTLMTLIRGQKLPIFSGSGMTHNDLAVQIVRQAKISGADSTNFGVVFAAMGVQKDVAEYFRKSFEESGVLSRVVMLLNLSNDPIIERTLTPRCALTIAEYLAFELDMHILVIMTDMTSYAEALREFSRLSLLRPRFSVRESGHDQGSFGFGNSDPDSHHAERRYHPPHSRPHRLHHRGSDRSRPHTPGSGFLSARKRSALAVASDEGRHRRRLHAR